MALIVALLFWVVGIPLVHGVLPVAMAARAPHYGWTQGRPGFGNWLGVSLVVVGTAGLLWIMVLHLAQTPARVELARTPAYLLRRGPYAFTRNPMYLAELALWLGWALFYGSVPVFLGVLVLWSLMHFIVLPWEEHHLERRFGEAYRHYQRTVPRWLGKTRR